MIVLRAGGEGDAVALAALEARTVAHPWTLAHYRDSLASHHCRVLEVDGKLVASVVWSLVVDEAELLNLVVDPAHQGRGLGRQLLDHLVDSVRGVASCIHLEVREGNAPARRLYLAQGFRQAGVRKNYYPADTTSAQQRENAILMVYDDQ